jgi:hypothetical protein
MKMQKLQFNTRSKGDQCEKLNLRKELYEAVTEFLTLSKNTIFPMFSSFTDFMLLIVLPIFNT